MTKKELKEYRALKLEIRDLQKRIWFIEGTANSPVQDKVRGSSKTFPYTARSFTVEGFGEDDDTHNRKLQYKQRIIENRKELLEKINSVEEYIQGIDDSETRLIYRMYYMDGKSQIDIGDELHLSQSEVSKRINEKIRDRVS